MPLTGIDSEGKDSAIQMNRLDIVNGTVTLSSNAGTVNAACGVITTESLSTAAGSAQALTITNSYCAATDMILVSINGGTWTTGTVDMKAVPGAGSFVITLTNRHASAAFNGTFIIAFLIVKKQA